MKHKSFRALALGLAAAQFVPLSSYMAVAETTDAEPQEAAAVAQTAATDEGTQQSTQALEITAPEFKAIEEGYTELPPAQAIVVKNTSNGEITITKAEIVVEKGKESEFTLTNGDKVVKITTPDSTSDVWTVQPKTGLTKGDHSGTVRFTYYIGEDTTTTTTADVTFVIKVTEKAAEEKIDITGSTVTLKNAEGLVYDGKAKEPAVDKVVLKDGKTELTADDYTVTYSNNTNATTADKKAVVTVEGKGKYEGKATAEFEIAKAEQKAPTLKVKSKTSTTITLEATGGIEGAEVEYKLADGDKWQTENVFKGLKSGTTYKFVARFKASDNYNASPETELEVKTNSASSGGSGGGGGSYRPSRPSTPSEPSPSTPTTPGGESKTWTDVASDLSKAQPGTTVPVVLGSDATVPAEVLVAAANNDTKLSLKVDDTFTWEIDGANISGEVSAANFGVKSESMPAQAIAMPALANCNSTKAISVANVPFGYKPVLTANVGAKEAGNFANLYKVDATGALVFAGVTQVDANGNAVIPLEENGTYVIAVDNETKMMGDLDNSMGMNANDAAALLKEIVTTQTTGAYKADVDGDGKVNAWDAAKILKIIVGLE